MGEVKQGNGEKGTLSFHIDKVGRTLRAEVYVRYPVDNKHITEVLEAYGGFITERFLKLEYKNKHKPELIQFGFVILKLDDIGQKLEGYFVGFGPRIEPVVWGYKNSMKRCEGHVCQARIEVTRYCLVVK